jgi:quinol monooxygenase YgiN
MTETTIIVAGRVFVPPADVETFLAEAQAIYPVAAANAGNMPFSFALEDAATGCVTVLEQWANQAALDAHLAIPQVQATFAKWIPLMRNQVSKFDAARQRDPLS